MSKFFVIFIVVFSSLHATTLKDYSLEALEKSKSLEVQNTLIKSTEYEIQKAKGGYLPTLNLNFSHTEYSEYKPTNQTQADQASIKLKYNLFNGFKDSRAILLSSKSYKLKKAEKAKLENQFLFDFVKAYIGLNKSYDIYKSSLKSLDVFETLSKTQDIKFKNHDITLKDYSKSKKDIVTKKMLLLDEELAYKNALLNFKYYVDFNETKVASLQKLDYNDTYMRSVNVFDILDLYSPKIDEAKHNLSVARAKMLKAKVNFYPKIDLIANKSINQIETQENPEPIEETSLTLVVKMNLYNATKDKNKYNIMLQKYKSTKAKLENIEKKEKKDLQESINLFKSLKIKYKLQEEIVQYMKQELQSVEYEYKGGSGSMVDVLKSLNELHSLEKKYISSRYTLITLKYKIYYQLGILKTKIQEDKGK